MTSQHSALAAVGAPGCGRPFGARSIGPVLPGAHALSSPSSPRLSGEEAATGHPPATTTERPLPDPALVLNQRDVELLRHLSSGESTAGAAAAMSITSNTVRTRIRRIQIKLAVGDRGSAVRRARESGTV